MTPTARPLTLTYLLADAREGVADVQRILADARGLVDRGHTIRVMTRGYDHVDFDERFEVEEVGDFQPGRVPASDVAIATHCTTLPAARLSDAQNAVHYCLAYEGDSSEQAEHLHLIEWFYRSGGLARITVSQHLAQRIARRFGSQPHCIPCGVPTDRFTPGNRPKIKGGTVRIGVTGAFETAWLDLRSALEGIKVARRRGLPCVLVRLSPGQSTPDEQEAWGELEVEWHEDTSIDERIEYFQSLDIYVGLCHGVAEEMCWPAIEALSCAVPSVLADASCYRQFSESKDFALFCPADNPIALGNRLLMLATRIDLRTEFGQLGRQVALTHDIEPHIDALESHLQSLVPEGRSLLERAAKGEVYRHDHDQPLINFGSDYQDVKYRLGISLLEAAILASTKGEIDWALSVARTATLLYPSMAEAWQTQGRLLCHLGFFSEAEPPLRRALRLDPRSPTVHEILGRLAFAQQRTEDAIHHYRQSVLLGMPGEQILIELAMAYLSQGSSKESTLALIEALRRNPRNGTAQGMLDRLQRGSGTFQALMSGKPSH